MVLSALAITGIAAGGSSVLGGTLGGVLGLKSNKSEDILKAEEMANNCRELKKVLDNVNEEKNEYILEIEDMETEISRIQQEYEIQAQEIDNEINSIISKSDDQVLSDDDKNTINERSAFLTNLGNTTNSRLNTLGLNINSIAEKTQYTKELETKASAYAEVTYNFGVAKVTSKREARKNAGSFAVIASTELKNAVSKSISLDTSLEGKFKTISVKNVNTNTTPQPASNEEKDPED